MPTSATEAAVAVLARFDLRTLPALGFDNTYAIAVHDDRAEAEAAHDSI